MAAKSTRQIANSKRSEVACSVSHRSMVGTRIVRPRAPHQGQQHGRQQKGFRAGTITEWGLAAVGPCPVHAGAERLP